MNCSGLRVVRISARVGRHVEKLATLIKKAGTRCSVRYALPSGCPTFAGTDTPLYRTMTLDRISGLLLPISALPSLCGIGDLGPSAYRFADALSAAGQSWWQVLPIGPVGYGYSPYSGISTFAGAPLLISPELLLQDNLVRPEDLAGADALPSGYVAYPQVKAWKSKILARAFARFQSQSRPDGYDRFCRDQAFWLDYYAAFRALGNHYGTPWTQWPAKHRKNPLQALHFVRAQLRSQWEEARFRQYIFNRQWELLRKYCRKLGLQIVGDMPIYVAHDSADVWAAQDQFHLDEQGNPTLVGGVPPDFFSATGQRWGNPLYRWDVMAEHGFHWWHDRFRRALAQYDVIRLDHFRGFAGFWAIPAEEKTAVRGRWIRGPGAPFFERITQRLGTLPVIAEDLGIITDDVRALMREFDFPGMSVLQFAFDSGDTNPYLPHNYGEQLVAYTGTHDNDTLLGWLGSAPARERTFAIKYLGLTPDNEHWQSIAAVMASRARVAVTPVQDVLGLGREARMNTPGTVSNNWRWRMDPDHLTMLHGKAGRQLQELTEQHGRRRKAY